MPALPPVPNTLRADVLWELNSFGTISTRTFWQYTGSNPSAAACAAIASHMSGLIVTNFIAHLSNSYALTGVKVTDLHSSSGFEGEVTGSTPGTAPGPFLTVNDCALVNYQIQRRYRGGKPRNYWPLGTANDTDVGRSWVSAFITAINTAWGNISSGMKGFSNGGTTISQHVNVSYYQGFTNYTGSGGRSKVRSNPRSSPLVDAIVNHSTASLVGTQRRRIRIT